MSAPTDADRATDFTVASPDGFLCPACGCAGGLRSRNYERGYGGLAGAGICPCCLFEPGFDDDQGASPDASPSILDPVIAYRRGWAAEGSGWRSASVPQPRDRSPELQPERLFRLAPFLRDETGRLSPP